MKLGHPPNLLSKRVLRPEMWIWFQVVGKNAALAHDPLYVGVLAGGVPAEIMVTHRQLVVKSEVGIRQPSCLLVIEVGAEREAFQRSCIVEHHNTIIILRESRRSDLEDVTQDMYDMCLRPRQFRINIDERTLQGHSGW